MLSYDPKSEQKRLKRKARKARASARRAVDPIRSRLVELGADTAWAMALPKKDLPTILRRWELQREDYLKILMGKHGGPVKANPIYDEPHREPVNKLAASMFWGAPKLGL